MEVSDWIKGFTPILGTTILVGYIWWLLFISKHTNPNSFQKIQNNLINLYSQKTPNWWPWGDKIWKSWQEAFFVAFVSLNIFTIIGWAFLFQEIFSLGSGTIYNTLLYVVIGCYLISLIIFFVIILFRKPQKFMFNYVRLKYNGRNPFAVRKKPIKKLPSKPETK
jgi:hypothetical protein